MHKPSFRQRETRLLVYWRAVDAEVIRRGHARVDFREICTLHHCSFSIEQAADVLAPRTRDSHVGA